MSEKPKRVVLVGKPSAAPDESRTSKGIAKRLLREAMRHTGGVYGLLTLLAEVVREDAGTSDLRRNDLAERVAKNIERARDEG